MNKESRQFMEGKHLQTLAFKLSLTPWLILCLPVLTIAYALPQYRMHLACYHVKIYREYKRSAYFLADEQSGDQDANA